MEALAVSAVSVVAKSSMDEEQGKVRPLYTLCSVPYRIKYCIS